MVSNELKQNIGEETSLNTIESWPQAHNVLHKKHHESLVTSFHECECALYWMEVGERREIEN